MPRGIAHPPLLRRNYLHHFVTHHGRPTHLQSITLCQNAYRFNDLMGKMLVELDPFQTRRHVSSHQVRDHIRLYSGIGTSTNLGVSV